MTVSRRAAGLSQTDRNGRLVSFSLSSAVSKNRAPSPPRKLENHTMPTRERASESPISSDLDHLTNPSARVQALTKAITAVADTLDPVVDLCRIYVDGLENLPRDGRFLLVGNHTSSGLPEIVLTPYFVRRELGARVRGLANRSFAETGGVARDVLEAAGAVVGHPDTGAELMRHGETVLVFPGGAGTCSSSKARNTSCIGKAAAGSHDWPSPMTIRSSRSDSSAVTTCTAASSNATASGSG